MTHDDSNDNPASSSVRVKAFRERLSSQFKRVEAYVTEDEKTRIQAVRTQENVTADVAVAGLLRLGLERYEELRTQGSASAEYGASSGAFVLGGAVSASASAHLGRSLDAALFAASASASGASFSGAMQPTSVSASAALKAPAPATTSPADSPVARFFKNRKEIVNE